MSTDTTLDNFVTVFTPASGTFKNTDYLMQQFCPEAGNFPCVGITSYGPQFVGYDEVVLLFDRLFHTFPDDLTLAPIPPRTYSQDKLTISVQTTLSGTHKGLWFPKTNKKHYSPPLSDIDPPKHKLMTLPACAVFTFDANNANSRITKLSIYFDRYLMQGQLN